MGIARSKANNKPIVLTLQQPCQARLLGKTEAPKLLPLAAEPEATWSSDLAQCVRKRRSVSEAGPCAAAKRIKSAENAERTASFLHGLDLDNAMKQGFRKEGLSFWVPLDPHRLPTDDLKPGEPEAPLWVGVSDEESTQSCLQNFLTRGPPKGQFHLHFGQIHRRHNDWNKALALAGNLDVWVTQIFECNVAHGPFDSKGFWKDVLGAMWRLASNLTPDHEMLLRFWQEICNDHGWTSPEELGAVARQRFIDTLPAAKPFTSFGLKAAWSRWYSVRKAVKEKDAHVGTRKMCLALLAIEKGWISHVDDLYVPVFREALPPAGSTAPSSSMSASSASSSSAAAAPAAVAKAAAKAKCKALTISGQKTDGKSVVGGLLSGSSNSLHAVLRLMCSPDRSEITRAILDLSEPLNDEHSDNASQVKDVESSVRYYIDAANFKWLGTLHATVAKLSDPTVLTRAGVKASVPPSETQKLSLTHADVAVQDAAAKRLWRISSCIFSERSASMMRHRTFPLALAPILDQTLAAGALAFFSKTWDSYVWGLDNMSSPTISRAVLSHSLHVRHMADTARIIRAHGLGDPTLTRVRRYFEGWGHEKMQEDNVKDIRTGEMRKSGNKSMKGARCYLTPIRSQIMEKQYDRKEIKITDVFPVSPDSVVQDAFFSHTGSFDEGDRLKLHLIKQKSDWVTFDAQSIRKQVLMEEMLRNLHITNSPLLAEEVWRSDLIPVRQFVLQKKTGPLQSWLMFVLYKCEFGVIGAPCKRIGVSSIAIDRDCKELECRSIYSLEGLHILPHDPISPMHAALAVDTGLVGKGICVNYRSPVQLLDWQATMAFASVHESTLKRLFVDRGLEAPSFAEAGCDYETTAALALMRSIVPGMNRDEANLALRARLSADDVSLHSDTLTGMPEDLVDDCVKVADKKVMRDYVVNAKKAKSKHESGLAKISSLVLHSFGKAKPATKSSVSQAAAKAKLDTVAGANRWWACIVGDPSFITAWAPAGLKLTVDSANGRFRFSYFDRGPNSVSWTERGMQNASLEVLRISWQWACERTGEQCPIPLTI